MDVTFVLMKILLRNQDIPGIINGAKNITDLGKLARVEVKVQRNMVIYWICSDIPCQHLSIPVFALHYEYECLY